MLPEVRRLALLHTGGIALTALLRRKRLPSRFRDRLHWHIRRSRCSCSRFAIGTSTSAHHGFTARATTNASCCIKRAPLSCAIAGVHSAHIGGERVLPATTRFCVLSSTNSRAPTSSCSCYVLATACARTRRVLVLRPRTIFRQQRRNAPRRPLLVLHHLLPPSNQTSRATVDRFTGRTAQQRL